MSILYLLVPAAAAAVVTAVTKGSASAPTEPWAQVSREIPDNPKTRAYAQAVAAVERFGKGPGSVTVFNGVSRWMETQALGQPTYPILSEKDLPAPPRGYIWLAIQKNSDASKSAHTIHYWELGSPPPSVPLPPRALVPVMTAAPAAPPPVPIGGIPDTEKTRAYRDALLLKQQAEAQAAGMMVAAVAYYVPGEVLSASDLPPASQGFRWVRQELAVKMGAPSASMWKYERIAGVPVAPVAPLSTPSNWSALVSQIVANAPPTAYAYK